MAGAALGEERETEDSAIENVNGWKQLNGEPPRNRTENPQIKSGPRE
jgi:hypothetical protein